MSRIWLVCFRFTCRRIQLILQSLFFLGFMSSYHMVCLLSLSWRPRSPHLVVWSVGVGAPTALWEEEAGCSTLLLPTVCQHSCTSAIPERCCSRRTMLHCGPRGAMLHLLLPSSTLERCYSVSMHCCYLYIHAHQCNALQCSPKAGNGQKFWA